MDTLPAPALRNSATPRLVPLADIGIPDHGLRRAATSAEQDAGMLDSVRRLGVLQPIILRPDPLALGRYILVAGRRRYRAAVAAGLGAIPAEVHDALDDADAAAIEAAENLQRAAMAPTDQWRAIVRLQELGWDLDGAAEALGIPARTTRRLAKLGTLHPDMLAAIEAHGMPSDPQLATIAAATPDAQAAALAKHAKGGHVDWWTLQGVLRQARIPKDRAIFDADASGLAWEEDLFAQPGAPDQFSTRDVAGFRAAQGAALQSRADASKGRLKVVAMEYGRPKIPPGLAQDYAWRWGDAIPKDATAFACVRADGQVYAVCARKPAKEDAADDDEHDDDETGPGPAGAKAAPGRFSSEGLHMLRRLRTDALRAAILDPPAPDPVAALRLLLIALGAENLVIEGNIRTDSGLGEIGAAAILAGADGARLSGIAMQAMARILVCGAEGSPRFHQNSGAAADWIGHHLDADRFLPRMDGMDLLDEAADDVLAEACRAAGITPGKTAAATRKALAGHAPDAVLFREAGFPPTPYSFSVEDRLVSPEDCGRAAGQDDCGVCGWEARPAKGQQRAPCDRDAFTTALSSLGLSLEEMEDAGDGRLRLLTTAQEEAPPPDHDAQRRADAKAFDAAEHAIPVGCGWHDGSTVCRHHGTPQCRDCDSCESYSLFLTTAGGEAAVKKWSEGKAPPSGAFDCGWSGASVCREEGTTLCEQLCPRHARYAEWLATTPSQAARRAADNQAARASLKRAKKKAAEA
jgi:ParB family transcriptional regulator, chromosome partitioning protein